MSDVIPELFTPSEIEPPLPIFSDYLEMTCLVLMFIIGAPLNLAAYTEISERPPSNRLDLLKKQLNLADLLIIFVYVPSRTCWLLTYDWRGGDLLCKIVKMLHNFAFQSSSNIVVCIAVDRLYSVLSSKHQCPSRAKGRTKAMLIVAWLLSFAVSVPQLFIWQDFVAIPSINWSQCLTMWEIARLENTSLSAHLYNTETFYSISHICLVFWIPAIIILLSYLIVLSWVWINSRPQLKSNVRQAGSLTGCDTVETVLTRASGTQHDVCQTQQTRTPNNKWNPLRTISFSKNTKDSKDEKKLHPTLPSIIVSDECTHPLTRPSITPSEASAVVRTNVHTGQTYHANINRTRALRVSFLLVTAYIVCWLPYNLLSLARLIEPQRFEPLSKLYFLHELMVFNSVLNPYLYGLFSTNTKQTARRNVPA